MSYPVAAHRNLNLRREPNRVDKWLLHQIFKAIGPAPVRFVIKDGAEMAPPGVNPVATVVIHDWRTLARLIVDPEVAFGEAFADGRIEVQGDLVAALAGVYRTWESGRAGRGRYQQLASKWLEGLQDNTHNGSLENIHSHYDLGNNFYKLWLDSELVYTCAYFPAPTATLEEAQRAKLDYVCRKLRLQPGETVVEAGCGWGALALHMAEHYGVSVKAYNISHEQVSFARQRAAERGLANRVVFIEDDYRKISAPADVFVSVGMLEHVGLRHFAEFGDVVYRAIGDRGRGLLHFIGRSYKGDFSRWIRKRIFPGAYAPALGESLNVLQPYHYAVTDVENLRPHYARTVEHWLQRFDQARERIDQMYDPWFSRAWRLYLAGSIAAFQAGTLQLFQICFAGSKCPQGPPLFPWTRDDLYKGSAS